jgi:hypothetical protein
LTRGGDTATRRVVVEDRGADGSMGWPADGHRVETAMGKS